MRRDELEELCYIAPIENIPSICQHGILSHNMARRLRARPASLAMQEVQDIRAKKSVPGGRALHDYANLYICARNPMLYKRLSQHAEICVLRINPDVLDIPGTVVTDGNAASDYTLFRPAPRGLEIVDRELTFLLDWRDADQITYWRKRRAKCAEALVPDRVPPQYLIGAYVSCDASLGAFNATATGIVGQVDGHLFFNVAG